MPPHSTNKLEYYTQSAYLCALNASRKKRFPSTGIQHNQHMKNFRFLVPVLLASATLTLLAGCLHIEEEVTFRSKGNGTYGMMLDMSEIKGMMDMVQGMAGDSSADAGNPDMSGADMSQMGQELSGVTASIQGIQGISNIREIMDTANYKFGYTFDFADMVALNRALKVINKEKYDTKAEEFFRYNGKSFERMSSGDLGEEIKKALAESEDADMEGSMDMVKMFFADMSYKQTYHFPDADIKKNSNALGEISADGHTLTVNIKPFDEEQLKQKVTVATQVKLK